MKKILDSKLFYFILGVIVATSVTVYAANTYYASGVLFSPEKEDEWAARDVETALNDLYQNQSENVCSIFEYNYPYSGEVQRLTIPKSGKYKLEVWGAEGGAGGATSGKGGYSSAVANLTKGTVVYTVVGSQGQSAGATSNESTWFYMNGGYNGGGGTKCGCGCGGGGGATHIATATGLLKDLSSNTDSILIVAGGGGGGAYWKNSPNYYNGGPAGTTTILAASGPRYGDGTFGLGGTGFGNKCGGAGGGGGYTGGSGGGSLGSGQGGTGYIKSTLTSQVMKAGNTSFKSPSDVNETGHSGNGYARITFVES